MKLFFSKHSPFARKVRIVSNVLGIQNKIELIATDIFNPPVNYKSVNPLIKVPALEMADGRMLTNSPFICQYLSQTTPGGQKIFPLGPELWSALNVQSIADGGSDAAVARRWEMHLRSSEKFDKKIDRLRLLPGQDLKKELNLFAQKMNLKAAFVVSCCGSLTRLKMRLADSNSIFDRKEKFEILSLQGTLSPDEPTCISA